MTVEILKKAIRNMSVYLEECHNENDTITLTAKVLKSIKENYEELVKFKNEADFVEVVRCKDCKKRGRWNCVKSKGEHPTTAKNNEFCCWGERKTSNG